MAGKIQNADIKSEAELVGLGADKTQLLNTTKMYSPKTTNVLENDLRKNNDAAIVAPAVTNDSSQGYEPGSRWIDTIAQKTYFCITNGVGTAIWKESGSGGGVGGVDILAVQTAENAVIGDFTQTGLEIVDSPIILHGKKSFRLIHQAASTRSFKQIIPVDSKFRGKLMTIEIDVVSTALSANLTLLVKNETTPGTPIQVAQQVTTGSQTITATVTSTSLSMTGLSQADFNKLKLGQVITGTGIQSGTTITGLQPATLSATLSLSATSTSTSTKTISALTTKRTFGFLMPEDCLSFSYTISALQEAGAPESYIDDIVIQLLASAMSSTTVTVPKNNDFGPTNMGPMIIGATTTVPTKGTVITDRVIASRISSRLIADYQYEQSAGGSIGSGDYLFTLPNGLQFDSTSVNFHTGAFLSTISPKCYVGVGWVSDGATIVNNISLIAYDSTRFRVSSTFSGTSTTFVSNISYSLSGTKGYGWHLDAPIAGWLANETETKTIPLTTAVLYQEQDSYIGLNTYNGYGTIGNKILRFSNIQKSIGSDIIYQDSVINGASFTVTKEGTYSFSFGSNHNTTSNLIIGLSVNASSLSTGVTAQSLNQILAVNEINVGNANRDGLYVSWTGYLNAGDVIRPHTNGVAVNSLLDVRFSASYQGSTKIINPSKDQKIDIPTHSLRFEGASTRGSTDTAIVKFDTMTNLKGDAWDVINTAANGTVITMKKAGRLIVSASVYSTTVGTSVFISKNQAILTTSPTNSESIAFGISSGSNDNVSITAPIDVIIGDKIRVTSNTAVNGTNLNLFTLSLQENSVGVALSNVLPQFTQSDSCVQVRTANGYGSVNTRLRRFSNIVNNLDAAITYVDSATLGGLFYAKEDGLYDISYTDIFATAGTLGISKNTTQPSTNVQSIPAVELLKCATTAAANYAQTVSTQEYLLKGDFVAAHTGGASNGADVNYEAKFTISKVGKPNLTSVDVTPFVNIKMQDVQSIEALTPTTTFGSTNTGVPVLNITKNTSNGIIRVDSSAAAGTSFVALKACNVAIDVSLTSNVLIGNASSFIAIDSTVLNLALPNGIIAQNSNLGTNIYYPMSANVNLAAGQTLRVQRDVVGINLINKVVITATAASDSIVTPTQQISSDTMNLVWKAAAIVDSDPIGTYNTLVYATTSNTANLAPTPPTQTLVSMNANGIQLFTRPYGSPGAAATPARFDIKVGTGLKGKDIFGFAGLARTLPVRTDKVQPSTTEAQGMDVTYDDKRGILSIDAGFNGGGVTSAFFKGAQGTNDTNYASAYIVFNIGTAPNLVSIPNLQPRIAYIKDVKASGTTGGSSIAGTQTRVLNDLVNNSGLGISLNANQITFTELGTFRITGGAPAFYCNQNKAYLFNVTDGTTPNSLIGGTTISGASAADSAQTLSYIDGEITITKTTVFELRHYTTAARSPNGLGVNSSNGINEIYSTLAIQKIR